MLCTQCGTENSDTSRFCMRCGSPLSPPAAAVPPPAPPAYGPPPPAAAVPPPAPPAYGPPPTPPAYGPPPPAAPAQQAPAQQAPAPQAPPVRGPQAQQMPPPAPYPAYGQQPPRSTPRPSMNVNAMNLWGPFGGRGTRMRHVAWILEGAGRQFQGLDEKFNTVFQARQVPQAGVNFEALTAKAVTAEHRPYLIVKRGPVNIGVYINQFGQDLFISMATFLKSPISRLRVIIISVMAVLWLLTTLLAPQMVGSISLSSIAGLFGGGGQSFSGFVYSIVSQLAAINNLALGLFVIYSVYKWLIEKDILAGLREKANEFNDDDLLALEFAVEQSIYQTLEEADLNPADLKTLRLAKHSKTLQI